MDAVQEMPGFAKYLKDLLTKKNNPLKHDTVGITHRVSAIISKTTVQKREDPGAFTIPCTIGKQDFSKALCDNGASINLMPFEIFKRSGLGIPWPTTMRLQMAERSIKRPIGVVDDVLVRIGKFLLSADFVILDWRVLMDLEKNEIKFRVNDEEVTFHANKSMKLPSLYQNISVINSFDVVDEAVGFNMEEECLDEAL
ncbi:uncharacterized protein LOC132601366 [Lycium barbarum]|uniref:uncharacterized protein LOC132601366 n=1 Tax=Lycium barbarum TaxID=112863 RepID=UPI00293F263A|nr:uncharacterized protein LOC132601366 [Lycium barbarum]